MIIPETVISREIPLTQGKVALVDERDYEIVSRYKWCAHRIGRTFYASMHVFRKGCTTIEYMHRLILNAPDGFSVDHIDGNGLNNQRVNLRIVSHRENIQNRHHKKSSRFPGVTFRKNKNFPWEACIQVDGKIRYLGCFLTEEEAHARYRGAECCVERGLPVPAAPSRIQKTSKYVGVSWFRDRGKWVAQIRVNGMQRKVGSFASEEEAHEAYERALEQILCQKLQ